MIYIAKHLTLQLHTVYGGGLASSFIGLGMLGGGNRRRILKQIKLKYMDRVIKIFLAILFFICLADMPYGYYQFVRFAGLFGFTILAYEANQQGKQREMIIYGGLALLFQPFFKVALGRQIWNIVDVVVGVALIITIFWKRKNTSSL